MIIKCVIFDLCVRRLIWTVLKLLILLRLFIQRRETRVPITDGADDRKQKFSLRAHAHLSQILCWLHFMKRSKLLDWIIDIGKLWNIQTVFESRMLSIGTLNESSVYLTMLSTVRLLPLPDASIRTNVRWRRPTLPSWNQQIVPDANANVRIEAANRRVSFRHQFGAFGYCGAVLESRIVPSSSFVEKEWSQFAIMESLSNT